ncbi:autotransporter outer membrane beta-barrel domain-containing protein [Erwinia sp. CPCC 100877]|nr:autotransporter outer membrane beta-barrel domain-containing protein [Erwinia sp. CPCC 100877]
MKVIKSKISIAVTFFIASLSHPAWGFSGDTLDDEQILSDTTYDNAYLRLDDGSHRQGITITGDTVFNVYGDSQIADTIVEDNACILLGQIGYNGVLGQTIIQNTTVNGHGLLDMDANSISRGQLLIGQDAGLFITNTDPFATDVSVNTPAPAGNVYIENLTLAGTATIGPSWIGHGEDGDAPLPATQGPVLVTRIDNLAMQSGSKLILQAYSSGFQFNRLELKKLSGTGNFIMSSSLADGYSDRIHVSEQASGQFGLTIKDSGREVSTPQNVRLVYINHGDAKFSLLNPNGIVEAGVWQYQLYNKEENGHTEWYLASTNPDELPKPDEDSSSSDITPPLHTDTPRPTLSRSARAVINMATAPRFILDTETSTLRQRMGDLRHNDGNIGVWARYLNNNSHLHDNRRYSAFHAGLNGLQVGADRKMVFTHGDLLLGAFTSYSKTTINAQHEGNGNIHSYSGGIYATWLDNSGFYLDTMLKGNHFNNELRSQMNSGDIIRGDYSQNALTAALESGYAIPLAQPFKLVPYGKVAYSRMGKSSYSLNNGMQADIHAANSIQGEIGTLIEAELGVAGYSINPYARVAISREFVKNNDIDINNLPFSSNYAGNTGKYGLGVTMNVSEKAAIYAEVNYQNGNKMETPVNASAGFRVNF